ncbi:uncharacterized protein BcabD6B2_44140 [Babesia caballi]|uniref:MAGE domain-containing protein n=1 Tax=Babesia caballi TaxID=5871 RepID=A0AAV4M2D5_BABCB|nr:hypothetical protein, conserved [Babesia caballi]
MMEDDAEGAYSQFMLSEHQTHDTAADSTVSAPTAAATAANSKYETEIKANEKSRILGAIVRLLLRRAPFTTRYDEVRGIVKAYLPDNANHMIVNCFIEDAKKLVGKTLGLTLCDARIPGGRRELFLKQSLAFHPHDLKILGEGDHEFRGFLLLLLPCMKAYSTGVPLGTQSTTPYHLFSDRLCEIFMRIGKGRMVPQDGAAEDALKTLLRATRRKKEVKHRASDFKSIADYLLYAKDLGYIMFAIDNSKGDTLAMISILPGFRLAVECLFAEIHLNWLQSTRRPT